MAYFSGPIEVGADGYARHDFDLPAFNGSVKVMAIAWSKTGVGQADNEVLVRDPIVLTASLPRFAGAGRPARACCWNWSMPRARPAMSASTSSASGVTLDRP